MNTYKACFRSSLKVKLKSTAIAILVAIFFTISHAKQNSSQIDSLQAVIDDRETNDSTKTVALNKLAETLLFTEQTRAFDLNLRAISLAKEKDHKKLYVEGLLKRAMFYRRTSHADSAIYYAKRCIEIGEKLNYKEVVGKSKNLLGAVYLSQGDNFSSLQAFLEALHLFEEIEHDSGRAASLSFIAFYYLKTKNYEKALDYLKKTKPVFQRLGRIDQLSYLYNNKGVAHHQLHQYDSALANYNKSLEMVIEQDAKSHIPIRELNIGKVYLAQKEYAKAKKYLDEALIHAHLYDNDRIVTAALIQLGILNNNQQNYVSAKDNLLSGLQSAKSVTAKDLEVQAMQHLAEVYHSLKQHDSAFFFQKAFTTLNDSLRQVENKNNLLYLQSKFEAHQKEKEIKILQQEAEIKDKLLVNIIIGVLLLTAIFIIIYINYRNRQKRQNLIHQHEEAISRQQIADLLKEQELSTVKERLKGQELERKRIAKELHDGIGGTLASIKLNLIQLVKKPELFSQKNLGTIIDRMGNACEEVRHISHNLTPPSFLNSNFTDIIERFLNKIAAGNNVNFSHELFDRKLLNNLEIDLKVDIYRILQELINNTLKHAQATEVHISLVAHDQYVNLMVEDDGIGMSEDPDAEGIGLRNIKSRLDLLDGSMIIDSFPNKGTIINIDIPTKTVSQIPEFR